MPQKRSKNNAADKSKLQKRANPGRSNASTNPNRTAPGKDNGSFFRSKSKINQLNMYNEKPDM